MEINDTQIKMSLVKKNHAKTKTQKGEKPRKLSG